MTRFTLQPSRILFVAFLVSHLAAATLIFPLQLAWAVKYALWSLIVASAAYAITRHAMLRTRHAILGATLHDGHIATITLRGNRCVDAHVLGTTYVTPSFTVINLRAAGERVARHAILVRDNIDCEEYRRVRVVLRWARTSPPAGDVKPTGSPAP